MDEAMDILDAIHKANDTTCVMCGAAVCTVDGCRGYRTSCGTSTVTSCPCNISHVWLCGTKCVKAWFALSVDERAEQWHNWVAVRMLDMSEAEASDG